MHNNKQNEQNLKHFTFPDKTGINLIQLTFLIASSSFGLSKVDTSLGPLLGSDVSFMLTPVMGEFKASDAPAVHLLAFAIALHSTAEDSHGNHGGGMLKWAPRLEGEKLELREDGRDVVIGQIVAGPLHGCLYSVDRQGALLEGRSDQNYAKQHPPLFTLFQVAVQLSAIKKKKKKVAFSKSHRFFSPQSFS